MPFFDSIYEGFNAIFKTNYNSYALKTQLKL